jgi:hypothetical protein
LVELGWKPEHARTGSAGYFGKWESTEESWQRIKVEPRSEEISRECEQEEQSPARIPDCKSFGGSCIRTEYGKKCAAAAASEITG